MDIHRQDAIRLHQQGFAHDLLESGQLHFEPVRIRGHINGSEYPGVIGRDFRHCSLVQVNDRDRDTGEHATGRIVDGPGQTAEILLSPYRSAAGQPDRAGHPDPEFHEIASNKAGESIH